MREFPDWEEKRDAGLAIGGNGILNGKGKIKQKREWEIEH